MVGLRRTFKRDRTDEWKNNREYDGTDGWRAYSLHGCRRRDSTMWLTHALAEVFAGRILMCC